MFPLVVILVNIFRLSSSRGNLNSSLHSSLANLLRMKLLLLFLTTAVTFVFADHTFGSLNRSKSVTPLVTSQGQTSKSDDLHAKFVQWKVS